MQTHSDNFFAHSLRDCPQSNWELLSDHLAAVAGDSSLGVEAGAANFAGAFGCADWGRLAGLWHDLGKYSRAYQDYIAGGATRGPDHSTAGARHAHERFGSWGMILAYTIAGHHAGLPDWTDSEAGGASGLRERLIKTDPVIPDAIASAPRDLLDQHKPEIPEQLEMLKPTHSGPGLRAAMFARMLFSCLVDADYLATEEFYNRNLAAARQRSPVDFGSLARILDEHIAQLMSKAEPSRVNAVRRNLLNACRNAAAHSPGIFSLTAPTGSGKTLSSLAFALSHAKRHGLRRVIYAVPFTSITEQIAGEFRSVFDTTGPDVVLEHHSAAAWVATENGESRPDSNRLAAENWDAPIIVTTNVRLLESLFACRPSACRRLHRVARSVIVLDEAQTLPVHLLSPTLIALDELVRGYGCSLVLSTATMPALERRENEFPIGLTNVREIAPAPAETARAMRRVTLDMQGKMDDEQLLDRLALHERVLVIVNTKPHAAALFCGLTGRAGCADHTYHLSAAMCPKHRHAVLDSVRNTLKPEPPYRPCRLISTQVVEAGIDIDFPVVYRAMAGLDSIIQAAGRCNREGRVDSGRVVVFDTDVRPPGDIAALADTAREIMSQHPDPLELDAIEHYFRLAYWQRRDQWDRENILDCFHVQKLAFQFRQAAARYHVIEDNSMPIVVPWSSKGTQICDAILKSDRLDRSMCRKAEPYTVSVSQHTYVTLIAAGACELMHERIAVLTNEYAYDENVGIVANTGPDAARLVC